jgi:hypothetical protein
VLIRVRAKPCGGSVSTVSYVYFMKDLCVAVLSQFGKLLVSPCTYRLRLLTAYDETERPKSAFGYKGYNLLPGCWRHADIDGYRRCFSIF